MNDTAALLSHIASNGYIRVPVPETAPNSINSVIVMNVSGVPTASTEYIKVTRISLRGETGLKTKAGIGIGTTSRVNYRLPFPVRQARPAGIEHENERRFPCT